MRYQLIFATRNEEYLKNIDVQFHADVRSAQLAAINVLTAKIKNGDNADITIEIRSIE